jgi:pilus assembly protein CpaC
MTIRPVQRALSLFLHSARTLLRVAAVIGLLLPGNLLAQPPGGQPIVYKVQDNNERLEMVINSSRILTMDKKVPQVQAANPDVVELTPLSATQVQLLAKKAGVTQVNLWDEDQKIHTIDVIVFPDARELAMLLQSQFPTTSLKVVPTANSVIVSGHVDDPNQISRIIQIAEDFYPKVINNITIAGVQQVLLKVKVLEVSRVKLRQVGFDFRVQSGQSFFQSAVSQILGTLPGQSPFNQPTLVATPTSDNLHLSFGIVNPNSAFLGFLDMLEQQEVATILAEPNLVAYSGRPASFLSGGQFPIPVPQSLGTISVQWKSYGTQVNFVPIVLGNGAIRLEVYPSVTEIDLTHAAVINGQTVPALKVREANTGVEMRAGQTLALAGLVQTQRQYTKRAVPWVGELPYVGALFRNMKGEDDEVELLLMVTPQLVEAMDPCDVPPGGPGLSTSSPTDWQMYMKGHIEVPRCPADDACRPSLSNGTIYEYGRHLEGAMAPPPVSGVVPQEEVIESPAPITPPSAKRPRSPAPPPMLPTTASNRKVAPARPALTVEPAPPRSEGNLTIDNRSVSYRPNNRSSRNEAAIAKKAQSPPGLIGPVGYDLKQ